VVARTSIRNGGMNRILGTIWIKAYLIPPPM